MEKKITNKETHENNEIIEYSIKNEYLEVRFLNIGGAITKVAMAEDDYEINLVLNYQNVSDYLNNKGYLNALVGRTANRITDGKFTINEQDYEVDLNDGPNNLHGGFENLTHKIFDITELENGYRLKTILPEQPDGFPGELCVTVDYTLEKNKIKIKYEATTDKTTIFNPTQHTYFNLSGNLERTIYDHVLQINGDNVAEINDASSFTKKLTPVAGTRFDFTTPTKIDPTDKPESALFDKATGYDHLYFLNAGRHAATLTDPKSGRKLEIFTTEPTMQFYAGNYIDDTYLFEGERIGEIHLGACFETHKNPFNFKSQILNPGEIYEQVATWVFTKE